MYESNTLMHQPRIMTSRPKFHIPAKYIMYDNERYELDSKGRFSEIDQNQPLKPSTRNQYFTTVSTLFSSRRRTLDSFNICIPETFVENPFSYDEQDTFNDPLNNGLLFRLIWLRFPTIINCQMVITI